MHFHIVPKYFWIFESSVDQNKEINLRGSIENTTNDCLLYDLNNYCCPQLFKKNVYTGVLSDNGFFTHTNFNGAIFVIFY